MPLLVADCPRCSAKEHTFDVLAANPCGLRYGWQKWFETFCRCRACQTTTIFVLKYSVHADYHILDGQGLMSYNNALNRYCDIDRFVNQSDVGAVGAPEHLPDDVKLAFDEGARSLAVGCWNAAGCMFRTSIDLTTKDLLPEEEIEGLSRHARRNLAPRLRWLFGAGRLPAGLQELSSCVKEDGDDAVHAAILEKSDAEDLLDFTVALLERIYTEPRKLEIALERRQKRRVVT